MNYLNAKARRGKITSTPVWRTLRYLGSHHRSSPPDLENAVIAVANEIGVKLSSSNFSACHRLPRDVTIVRFTSRKNKDPLFKNGRKLNDKDLSAHLGPNHQPVFINPNLSPEFRAMRWKAKRMKEAGLVFAFGVSRRGAFVQASEGAEKVAVEMDSDFDQFLGDKSLHEVLYTDVAEQAA